MKRRIIVTSVSPGYMFGLNACVNAAKYFGTQCEFHILQRGIEPGYMRLFSEKCGLPVQWVDLGAWGEGFNIPKYGYAASLAGKCDSICLIDADLFICANIDEHFTKAEEGYLTTAYHEHSATRIEHIDFAHPENIGDRGICSLADFPLFVDPERYRDMLTYWYTNCHEFGTEYDHPLIVMNRSIAMHVKPQWIIPLDGHHWVADMRYWSFPFSVRDKMLFDAEGRIYASHNKWWRDGRVAGEFIAGRQHRPATEPEASQHDANLNTGQNNFNLIVALMKEYVALVPEIACPCPAKHPFDRHQIWKQFGGSNA